MALLLLASAARSTKVEAATVDHGLRPEAREEAAMVSRLCGQLGVPHSTLTANWEAKPATAVQEQAREARYALLAGWARERELDALATAHHLDDQAETVLMRLNRGAGVRGLAGIRPAATVPGSTLPLLRPLLSWRRPELEALCAVAGVIPVVDPTNEDEQFERVRVRRGLSGAQWLAPEGIARSGSNLADAETGLEWAADLEWERQVSVKNGEITYRPAAPREIRRRVVARAVAALASEGQGNALRGREVDSLLETLFAGGTITLRGVSCSGGDEWRFRPAPARRR